MSEAILTGLLFADRIIEEINHKKTIVGTFTTFHAQQVPVMYPPWFVYAGTTNLDPGSHSFSLSLMSEETKAVLFSVHGNFENNSRRDSIELIPMIPNVVFPALGDYLISFFIDGDLIGNRILEVKAP